MLTRLKRLFRRDKTPSVPVRHVPRDGEWPRPVTAIKPAAPPSPPPLRPSATTGRVSASNEEGFHPTIAFAYDPTYSRSPAPSPAPAQPAFVSGGGGDFGGGGASASWDSGSSDTSSSSSSSDSSCSTSSD